MTPEQKKLIQDAVSVAKARKRMTNSAIKAGKMASEQSIKRQGKIERERERQEKRERERERTARERAEKALENFLIVANYYSTHEDPGELWIDFLRSLRLMHRPGEIMVNNKILKHLKELFYLLDPHHKQEIIGFLVGSAQTGDYIDFRDMGYMEDGKAFPTWFLEKLKENSRFHRGISVYRKPPQ